MEEERFMRAEVDLEYNPSPSLVANFEEAVEKGQQ